jgi:hypothetical protein
MDVTEDLAVALGNVQPSAEIAVSWLLSVANCIFVVTPRSWLFFAGRTCTIIKILLLHLIELLACIHMPYSLLQLSR